MVKNGLKSNLNKFQEIPMISVHFLWFFLSLKDLESFLDIFKVFRGNGGFSKKKMSVALDETPLYHQLMSKNFIDFYWFNWRQLSMTFIMLYFEIYWKGYLLINNNINFYDLFLNICNEKKLNLNSIFDFFKWSINYSFFFLT